MTTETAPATTQPPYAVVAQPGTRLEQLQAEYPSAKAAAKEADDRLKAITDGIKAELQGAVPDRPSIELRGAGDVPTLELRYVESWRVDSTKLKREDPETYVRYAVKSGSWRLAEQRGQR
jgi:hypothetical protein